MLGDLQEVGDGDGALGELVDLDGEFEAGASVLSGDMIEMAAVDAELLGDLVAVNVLIYEPPAEAALPSWGTAGRTLPRAGRTSW
jgi:hypothetical protein